MKTLEQKHYKRMKGFLTYDLEGSSEEEQEIILQQTIIVAQEMLQKRGFLDGKKNDKELHKQE